MFGDFKSILLHLKKKSVKLIFSIFFSQVKAGDTRDSDGKARFFPVKLNNLVFQNQFLEEKFWIFNYLSYPLSLVTF